MFTGLVEGFGRITGKSSKNGVTRFEIGDASISDGVKIGDSIAVNGVCLTVAEIKKSVLFFDVMRETLAHTNLNKLKLNDEVNLERALKIGDRLGGHFVTGHIDCVGVIRSKKRTQANVSFHIGIKPQFLKYLIQRGSVALDGISLTIAEVKSGGFTVCIIPHTLEKTILKDKAAGDEVNIELDMLVKSVKK